MNHNTNNKVYKEIKKSPREKQLKYGGGGGAPLLKRDARHFLYLKFCILWCLVKFVFILADTYQNIFLEIMFSYISGTLSFFLLNIEQKSSNIKLQ